MLSGTKQKPLPLPPKSSSCKVSSPPPVGVQDEIEIEIAEVLYGMMRMPLATSKQESSGNEDVVKSKVSSPISTSQTVLHSSTINATSIARKKPRHVRYDDENSPSLQSRAEAPSKSQAPSGDQLKRSGSAEESTSVLDSTSTQARDSSTAALDSRSAEKKESNLSKEETVMPKVESSSGVRSDGDGATTVSGAKSSSPEKEKEKFEIDLMAPPPVKSSSERGVELEGVAAEAKPKATEVETEAKPLLKVDGGSAKILESEEKKRPRSTVAETEHHKPSRELKLDLDKSDHVGVINKHHHVQKQPPQQQVSVLDKTAQANPLPMHMSMPRWPGGLPTMGYMPPTQGVVPTDTSSLSSAAMQPPSHLLFNQPRPKRCATHCYIARNIQSHQQFTKMNPFWPAAAGSAPCNLSLMPPTELQGTVLGRSSNPGSDKNSKSTSKSSDTAQRNQILLQQALPQGAASNIMHGPTFIFPVGQQPHTATASVRPPNSGNTASSGATATANSMNGPGSATPAGAPTMTFSYPGMPGNETQYLAILQNNGYPFPVPAHVGAPPAYRGASGQPIPFFNGSFYPSQMIQPPFSQPHKQQQAGQILQSHAPSNQNGSVSTGSSAAQKHLQNQQLRPPINPGNPQGFPTHKVQSQPMSFQQRQPRENATQHSETVGGDSPSDSRGSRSSVAYGQNYGMQIQPTNLGLMSSAAPGGGVVVSSSNHGEKKPQQVSKAGVESFPSQGYAMTFATFNGASSTPSLNMSSIPQNHAVFHSLPEAARQGYQMMAANVAAQAAQQKMNYSAPSDDGKSGSNATANTREDQKKTGGATGKTSGVNGAQSIAFSNKHDLADASVSAVTSGSIVDTSRLLNHGSTQPQNSSSVLTSHQQQQLQHLQQQHQQQQQHMQRSQLQQPYTTMYLQKQQRYATSVAASAARTKGPVAASNGSGFPDHNISVSPAGSAKFTNVSSGFPQNLVQSSSSQVQSPQWKNNSPRTTNTSQAQSPSMLSPSSSAAAASSVRSVSHKQQSRPQQSQISFASNSKPMASGSPMQQVQGGTNNQAPSPPMLVGSPSTSSVSKSAGGSPRTTASASSAVNKAGQASSTTHSSSQPSKNLQSASAASSTGGRNNGPSLLGNPSTSSGSKSQQQQQQLPKQGLQQQAQLFFSNPYMQSQHQHQQQQITISPSGGYYIQRHQQQPGSSAATSATVCHPVTLSACTTGAVTATTSDPAKAIAAAAAVSNMKGGGGGLGKTQQHQLVPPGFPYVHAVPSAKPVDQKQQAGE
ncbi:Protein TIME FOR COFFEE [Hirschfeldia incana]|nr:Protein TIME FOR COFFEE [Hirschfeldia incana]